MKALYTLIVPALLTGCSYLKPVQSAPSELPKPESVKTVPVEKKAVAVDKADTDKPKILTPIHVDTLPLLPVTDFSKSISIPSTTPNSISTPSTTPNSTSAPAKTPKVEPNIPVDGEQIPPFKKLKVGSRGEAVLAMKKRLAELHYDVGNVNKYYDKQTRQAVLAFQKYAELKRTGTYTLETQEALLEAMPAEGLHPELGLPRIEIDLTRQVLLFFDEKELNRILAVSTGTNRKYCDRSKKSGKRVCGVAHTPQGTFKIQRRIPGWRESDLGKLYNPLYFNGGYAIHGSPSVPHYNASHGCVRISIASSRWFYETVKNGTPVILFE
jgi:hypothetical protein